MLEPNISSENVTFNNVEIDEIGARRQFDFTDR